MRYGIEISRRASSRPTPAASSLRRALRISRQMRAVQPLRRHASRRCLHLAEAVVAAIPGAPPESAADTPRSNWRRFGLATTEPGRRQVRSLARPEITLGASFCYGLLDPQAPMNGNLIQCHRVSLCEVIGFRPRTRALQKFQSDCWCLSDVGRERIGSGGCNDGYAGQASWYRPVSTGLICAERYGGYELDHTRKDRSRCSASWAATCIRSTSHGSRSPGMRQSANYGRMHRPVRCRRPASGVERGSRRDDRRLGAISSGTRVIPSRIGELRPERHVVDGEHGLCLPVEPFRHDDRETERLRPADAAWSTDPASRSVMLETALGRRPERHGPARDRAASRWWCRDLFDRRGAGQSGVRGLPRRGRRPTSVRPTPLSDLRRWRCSLEIGKVEIEVTAVRIARGALSLVSRKARRTAHDDGGIQTPTREPTAQLGKSACAGSPPTSPASSTPSLRLRSIAGTDPTTSSELFDMPSIVERHLCGTCLRIQL